MNKRTKSLIILVLWYALFGFSAQAGQKIMSVQVKNSQVRQQPTFLGKVLTSLSYGDRVTVLEEKGPWIKVSAQSGSISGWMHESALTKKKIRMDAGADDVEQAASSDELALAGKGFNKQVEGEFKANNPDVDFTWIDKMEKFRIEQSQLEQFLDQGDLLMEGGVQ